ncbi:hypothetical protein HNY73_006454 [Argiope bruennichi]|uniref:Transcriptional coactivator p15 (PC4) C-terminal domain-containing protein n=1 Tax=Argiope bruennichi TaxID=94029 RepID=A0A8T0FSD1_ARGBR|nr:hypothetical protein HNY73_006454 [Argiope bruennichi]
MSFVNAHISSKRKNEQREQVVKKRCNNDRTEQEISLSKLPKNMVHLDDGLSVVVNSFLKETRVHIRVYVTDDNGFLRPTKEGVSLKPEEWSSVLFTLRTFSALLDPDAVAVVKKDVCIFNHSANSQMCISLQRLFQRNDNSFHLVPERVIIRGVQIEHLLDSQNRIFNCVKSSLIEYTLRERVIFEIQKYPYDEKLDDWDADTPQGYDELSRLLDLSPTQTAVENGQWVEFHPLSNVFDGGPVEFHISGSGEEYLDLSQTQLYVKAKILKADGSPILKETKTDSDSSTSRESTSTKTNIGPVNLFLHSIFSQVDVSLNDRLVSNSSNTYPYRSYIETLLNHGYDSKTSQLTSEMFYSDNHDRLKKRSKFFESSATVDMIGGLHSDLFHQERLLLNLVDVKIKLIRSKPEFCLQGDEGYKVVLEKINLLVRKVRVSPGVILGHVKALEKETAKYPINRVLCKVYSIPQGSMSMVQDNIFVGQMPKRIIIGCVENDAFHGTFQKSPFEFKHFDMNFIGIYVDGPASPT